MFEIAPGVCWSLSLLVSRRHRPSAVLLAESLPIEKQAWELFFTDITMTFYLLKVFRV